MILVGGQPVASAGTSKESILFNLLEHPLLVESATTLLRAEQRVYKAPSPSGNERDVCEGTKDLASTTELDESMTDPRYVYIFQKEMATVTPLFAEMVGTDEITTCIGLVLRDPLSGLTSVGHFDTAGSVQAGVDQLINDVISFTCSTIQVHLVGAFDDSSDYEESGLSPKSRGQVTRDNITEAKGYSWPLALTTVEALHNHPLSFEMETCCILGHNTSTGSNGHPCPSIRGFMVETSSGQFFPATFDSEARGPDAIVRQLVAACAGSLNPHINKLISPYDTHSDTFTIGPAKWSSAFIKYAYKMLRLSDEQLLDNFSTSPHAENAEFASLSRSMFTYLTQKSLPEQSFLKNQPRVFARTSTGGWIRRQ